MNKNLIFGMVILAAVGAGYFFFKAKENQPASSVKLTTSESTSETENAVAMSEADDRLPSTITTSNISKGVSRDIELSEFQRLDPRITALDEKEAQWLKRHGYPTEKDIQDLDLISDEQLAVRISQKDPMGSVLRGLKYEKSGDLRKAIASYSVAARRGSLYAKQRYAELSRASALADLGNLDPYAYNASYLTELELAKYMGDHRANEAQAARVFPPGTRFGDYSRDVLSMFQGLLAQYNTAYKRQYGRMPQPDPRPNAELWAKIDDGRVKTVTIFVPYK